MARWPPSDMLAHSFELIEVFHRLIIKPIPLSSTSCLAEFNTSYFSPDSTQDILAKELFKRPPSKAFYL